jgi:hypothetical protein
VYNPNTISGDTMTHAKIKLPKPTVHSGHPFVNKFTHQKLLEYLQQRLLLGKQHRDAEINRLIKIDKNVAGWMQLNDEDKKRKSEQESTGVPQAVVMNLPLSFVHLDDMMTYFAQTFAPNRGMFYHTGKPDEVGPAAQIVTIMNNNAVYAGYYREVLQAVYSLLKYNNGGLTVEWAEDNGPKIVRNADGNIETGTELKWQGNRIEAIDMYNLLRDPHVHPTKLHCDGEFAAKVKMRSHYWLQNAASQGKYYNCEAAMENHEGMSTTEYYRNPPQEANFSSSDSSGSTNWINILREYSTDGRAGGFELVEIHIKLNPTEFGLIPGTAAERAMRSRYEMWRFTILNNQWIIDAKYMDNVHGHLPFFMGVLNDDQMGTGQKSTAEILQPLQDFASFLLNTHVYATRKNIWGLIGYDPTMIDLRQVPTGEVAARVPVKPEAYGKDIRTFIYEHNGTLETKQTMSDLESVMGIISQFFPTQSLPSQIASIDRAVDSQVAAVQQGANRRQQKAARLLDDTVFRNMRFAMYYNLLQYQPAESEVTDFFTGKVVQIDLTQLRSTDLPFIIGQGLKAIDRQATASNLQQIIFALIQAPQASQGIDLLGMIDYWTSMIDVDIDMKQFRLPAAPSPEGEAVAEAEVATGIQPATNPQAISQPIYG